MRAGGKSTAVLCVYLCPFAWSNNEKVRGHTLFTDTSEPSAPFY